MTSAPPRSPTTNQQLGDLPVADLVENGHAVLDWIAEYLSHPERYPVLSHAVPGEIRSQLPSEPPAQGEPLETMLADFERVIVPGITHWNHPSFFGYFATSASVPGIVAEMLIAALDVKAMLWRTSPAATELEIVVSDWLRQMLGLGSGWFGFLTDTASISTFLALAAAREDKPELAIRERGMTGRADLPRLRVYTSEHAHSAADKAVIALGIGLENLVHIPADADYRMRTDALERAIAEDKARGYLPLACIATVGTTSTTSVDPVPAIARICSDEGLWLHVDGAYGGIAAIVPEMREILAGVEHADSIVVNPHKWLFTPFDCSAFFTRKPDVLKRAFSLVPEFLLTPERESVVDFMDYGVQLGRRFRALKLWMVIRAFGTTGLADRIREHCRLAREFAEWVRRDPDWEVVAPVPMSLVCFRYAPGGAHQEALNAHNERILARVNAGGEIFLSHTKLGGRYVLRFSVANIRTEERHVRRAWELLRKAATESA